ncbi:SMP-30/gluconolactonase/LRE family protein [Plantactinospora endophytica]|uniref:Gluconolactonase n=1 Tax=Plantactinospora endophytica TaxID=673535 RepID=A0ABQ4EGM4_9ACTN|nr:SMP-30/gluconolactonase/LRE family protein [Plantactinospora endophytica]GIG93391.1 gluconolactonase [Plantactinospora endophytica]
MVDATQVTDPCCRHGEGPVWDPGTDRLLWVDMLAGDVLTTAPGTEQVARHHVDTVAAVVRPRAAGGYLVAVERGFVLTDDQFRTVRRLPDLWTDPDLRMNEGGCDPAGRFYCGSMAYDSRPGAGALYRLDADLVARRVLADVTISNGLAWSADGSLAYYVDTPTQRVDVFDYDPENAVLTDRRPFVRIDPSDGAPDGLTLDAEGGVWVALWGGAEVRRYAPDGALDVRIPLPARQVTACTFGGPGLRDLYITTSRLGLADPEPAAGALFRASPGVAGLPVVPFRY